MLRDNEMIATLVDVVERLQRLGIDYMVTGSFAMAAYVTARTTMDIDLVLRVGSVSPRAFEQAFAGDYYVNEASVARASERESVFNVINNRTLVKVDCIVGRKDHWEAERFERRTKAKLGDDEFWTIGKEDLIVAKVKWASESSSERQFEDIATLVASGVDQARLRSLVISSGAEKAWDAFEKWMTRARK